MKVSKLSEKQIRPGVKVSTVNWSASSDLGEFTVIETFEDGWIKVVDANGKFRMFERTHVKRLR